jgi:hypothetical protein
VADIQTGAPTLKTIFDDRFKFMVVDWAETAKPGIYFIIPGSKIEIHKDYDSKLHVIYPEPDGSKIRMSIDNWKQISRTASFANLSTKENVQSGRTHLTTPDQIAAHRSHGNPTQLQTDDKKSKAGQRTGHHQPSVPTHRSNDTEVRLVSSLSASGPSKQPLSFSEPFKLSSSPRTPSQADKKYLAADILRALKPSAVEKLGSKRPHSDLSATHPLEQPPAKRHAPEPGVKAATPVTNQSRNAGTNGVIPYDTAAQAFCSNVSTEGDLAPIAPYLPSSQLPTPSVPPPKVPPSQPPVQPSVTPTPAPSQMTAQLPTSLSLPIQLPSSVPPSSTSTHTLLTSQTPGQHAAQPSSSTHTSNTMLPTQTETRPLNPSASESKATSTPSKARLRPFVELPPSPFASASATTGQASTPLPKRKPLERSDSVPLIAPLPMTPEPVAKNVASNDIIAQRPCESSSTSQQPTKRLKTPLFLPSPMSSPSIEILDDTSVSEDPLQIGGLGDMNTIKSPNLQRPKPRDQQRTRARPYVLVPPRPTYLKRFKAWQSENAKGQNVRGRQVLEGRVVMLERWSSSRLLEEPGMGLSCKQKML